MGKGSAPRPFSVHKHVFDQNWDTIFSKKEIPMQVRTEQISEGGSPCGCGRSPTGKCIGWHALTEEAYIIKMNEYNRANLSNREDEQCPHG